MLSMYVNECTQISNNKTACIDVGEGFWNCTLSFFLAGDRTPTPATPLNSEDWYQPVIEVFVNLRFTRIVLGWVYLSPAVITDGYYEQQNNQRNNQKNSQDG